MPPQLLPRQDNWGSAPVVSACSAVAAARGASATAAEKKKLLPLQRPCAPAHPRRLFCSFSDFLKAAEAGPARHGALLSFAVARNRLQDAVAGNHRDRALEALAELKAFAGSEHYYGDGYRATELLLAALSPLARLCKGQGLGVDDDGAVVTKESLAVACLLLRNASAEIGATLCEEISQEEDVKSSLERIRDRSGCDCDEVRELANEILARLPSTPN